MCRIAISFLKRCPHTRTQSSSTQLYPACYCRLHTSYVSMSPTVGGIIINKHFVKRVSIFDIVTKFKLKNTFPFYY